MATRVGYKIMCDLGATFDMVHIGLQEVTSKMPAPASTPVAVPEMKAGPYDISAGDVILNLTEAGSKDVPQKAAAD